jgi:urease accessory protein
MHVDDSEARRGETMLRLHGIIGHADEASHAELLRTLGHRDRIEFLYLRPSDAGRKRFRLRTDRGTDCAVSLDRDEDLTDGSLLYLAPDCAIIARFGEQAIWRLLPVDHGAALKLGWNAGNLHWRVRFEGDYLHVLLDAPLHTYRARIQSLLNSGEVEELADV